MKCCPGCGSRRIKRYHRGVHEYYCKACGGVFNIEENFPSRCYKCERIIEDYSKATRMGNGKHKHNRCRRQKNPNLHLKEVAR
jgi:hypothetical protein